MRAIQVTSLEGPSGLVVADVPEPSVGPGQVLVEVRSVGVAFPDLLLSKGQYQLKPEVPFVAGSDFAGVVISGEGFEPGTRVAGVGAIGGTGERVAAEASMVLPLPDELSFDEGAALPMNYLTAHFVLKERAQLATGETVLVHGAAGGVGTATIQVAKGLGARVIAVVSTDAKAAVAETAGADDVVLLDGFRDTVRGLTDGNGVDVIVDPVGGEIFTDSLRCLAEQGRLIVVGFASGQGIPEVRVNRLLLNNIDVRGAGWGAYALTRPEYCRQQWEEILPMIASGVVKPPIGAVYPFEQYAQALVDMDERKTLGKSVVRVKE